MEEWLLKNAVALLALLVATVGGWPGILKILEYCRPLSGSIKYFAATKSSDPPGDGILIALTIVNKGNKNIVWRRLNCIMKTKEGNIVLKPVLIPNSLLLNNKMPQPDLLNQQTFFPGIAINAYLLLIGDLYLQINRESNYDKLNLRFETEQGRTAKVELSFAPHPLGEKETFPTHPI